jgi:hypothetical protein
MIEDSTNLNSELIELIELINRQNEQSEHISES